MLLIYFLDKFQKLVNSLTCLCTDEYNFRIRHKRKFFTHTHCKVFHSLCVFRNNIPLINCKNTSLTLLVSIAGNLCVLFCNTLVCVNHNNAHVTSVRRKRTYNTVTLYVFVNLTAFSHTGGIDKQILVAVLFVM